MKLLGAGSLCADCLLFGVGNPGVVVVVDFQARLELGLVFAKVIVDVGRRT